MIDWMSSWLKQIVLIILFAAFVDLILPNHSMQRYVKVVISLVILLAILEPVITIVQGDLIWDQGRISSAISSAGGAGASGKQMKPLAAILQDAEVLKADNQREWEQVVEAKLSAMIQDNLERDFPQRVKQVSVKVAGGNERKPHIVSVQVVLTDQQDANGSKKNPQKSVMVTVEPVEVQPMQKLEIPKNEHNPSVTAEHQTNVEWNRLKSRIMQQVMSTWDLTANQVEVEKV